MVHESIVVEAAIFRKSHIGEALIETKQEKITVACLDENVYFALEVFKKYFIRNGWLPVQDVITSIKSNAIFY